MKKIFFVLIGISALAIGACTAQKKTAQKGNTSAQASAITAVKMDRTACFGRCPIYSIEVRKDGTVVYTGKRFTDHNGVYTKNIGVDNAAAIIRGFNTHRADTCKERYDVLISDLPGINYTLSVDTGKKMIYNANYGPAFLKELAGDIDSRVKVDASWKKLADTVID